jgi:DNA-binding NarL/FixJ family response regulator
MDMTPLLGPAGQGREEAIALLRGRTLMIVSGRRLLITLITCAVGEPGQWIGAATCEEQGLALLRVRRPDLLFVTHPLESGSGCQLVQQAKRLYPGLACLLLLERDSPDTLLAALESNCDGICLDRRVGLGTLAAAIKAVLGSGGVYMDTAVADMLHRTSRGWSDGEPERLTPRERQVLEAMIQGCETREMAQRFHISVETVRSHIKAVLAKLNAHTRLDASLIALRLGLVRWDQPS